MDKQTRSAIDNLKIHGANLQVSRFLGGKLDGAQRNLAEATSIAWAMKASDNPMEFCRAWRHGDLREALQAAKNGITEAEEILKEIQPL